ncbi:MAG TPA: hypothetical protein VFS20_00190, partial [Longimicrobium sp.]|nr:hypothetical protein [Longimicrobium sp.]
MNSITSPRFRWVAALALLLVPVFAGSAAAQQRDRSSVVAFRSDAPETSSRSASAPADVWRALSEVYAEMGFPLANTANPRAHEYLTPFMELRGRLFNQPNSAYFVCQQFDLLNDMTNSGQITFAIRTRLVPRDGGTELRTQVDARARRRTSGSSWVECNTTGEFEKTLARMVDERLQQPAAAPAA